MSWWGNDSEGLSEDEEEKQQSPSQSSTQDSTHSLFKTTVLPYNESCDRTRNCWSDPSASNFSVRGKDYLEDRRKIPATHSRYALLGMDILRRSSGGVGCIATREATSLANARAKGFTGFVFILNFVLADLNLIVYWTPVRNVLTGKRGKKMRKKKKALKDYLTGHEVFDILMEKFVESDDEFRNSRLKVIPVLVKGSWVVGTVVNGRPAILCNKIKTTWYRDLRPNQNYLEGDIEITSSSMAMGILSLVKMYTHTVALDMAFTIEGQSSSELPEEILCALRFHHLEPDNSPEWPEECFKSSADQNGVEDDEEDESSSSSIAISEESSSSPKIPVPRQEPEIRPKSKSGGGKGGGGKKKRGKKGRKHH